MPLLRKMWSDLHQSYFVMAFSVGVIAGVILGMVTKVNFFTSLIWVVLAVVIMIFVYLKPKAIFMLVAFLAGVIVAFFRISIELSGNEYVKQLVGEKVLVTGEVDMDPETDDGATKIRLKNLRFSDEEIYVHGILYVSVSKNEKIRWGDTLKLSGKMSDGFGTFVGYMYRPRIVEMARPEPGNLVLKIRDWFAERIKRLIIEPEVNLGLSYLLGMKSGLSDELAESLRVVGLTHIVVASGAHLSILVGIARKIFGKVSRFTGFLFAVLFILFFMVMVGWTPSILRAGVMSILTLMAWYVGRKIAPFRLIIMVGAFTLILNPSFVINLGWLLSMASYSGIMILGPKMTRFFYGAREPGFIGSTIITTIAATIMTLPIVLYFYGMTSLVSVLANLIILPTLPYAMGLVFITGIVMGIPGIQVVVGWCATLILKFHIVVIGFFGQMTQFLIRIDTEQMWVFLLYIPILGLCLFASFKSIQARKKATDWTFMLKDGKIKVS